MRTLKTLSIQNYKSIRDQTLELGRLNILIGGNGSGKSNLISVFRFLRELVSQNLAGYTLQKGGADSLLYFGRRTSPEMSLNILFEESGIENGYRVVLSGSDEDALFVKMEEATYRDASHVAPKVEHLSGNVPEAMIDRVSAGVGFYVARNLRSYRVYHFHDTSDLAAMKSFCSVDDNRYLREQSDNLAAMLYLLQERSAKDFSLIESTIRQVAPFFERFLLAPSRHNPEKIRLEWKEKGSDAYFNATALSDGTLRFICLATLLLQPDLPSLIILDEPELGLHPAAIQLLAAMLSSASTRTQIIVATQSVTLVNQFEPKDIWTVEREDGQSVFRRLDEPAIEGWLEDYSLGELWEKNVLGARS